MPKKAEKKQLMFEKFSTLYVHLIRLRMPAKAHLEAFSSAWSDAKIFLCDGKAVFNKNSAAFGQVVPDVEIDYQDFSPPFKNFYFESHDEHCLGCLESLDKTARTEIYGILVSEKSPGIFDIYSMVFNPSAPTPREMGVPIFFTVAARSSGMDVMVGPLGKDPRHATAHAITSIVGNFLKMLRHGYAGSEKYFRSVPGGMSGNLKNRNKYVSEIIHISDKENYSSVKPVRATHISWDFRHWVRGHWRKLDNVMSHGKDRNGDYNISGFTWVTEHLRGDESLPVKDQIRMLEYTGDT